MQAVVLSTASSRRRLRSVIALGALLSITVACSNRESDDTSPTAAPATEAPAETSAPTDSEAPPATEVPAVPMFGTMESPCGPATEAGVPTIADGQNGGSTLKLGTQNDHGYEGAPGLTIEMLDAAKAFAGWCNEQGGIRGLQIDVVDLDGKLFNVPAAIEQACAEVFAMVGGGWVFDDQMYPRFHECGMVSLPGYTVSTAAAEGNGKVQPLPNPAYVKPIGWLKWGAETYPDAVKNTAIVYSDVTITKINADQIAAGMEAVGGYEVTQMIAYSPTGEANWVPFAQKLKDGDVTAMAFVGEPGNLILLYKAMREVGYVPELVFADANHYTEQMVAEGNSTATEGFRVRTAYAPFEEADQFPGMRSYLDMMAAHNPNGRIAGLGLQATSAYLLFATAANQCLDSNNNVLERECVLAAAKTITSWNAGGLHTESNPAEGLPPECGIIMGIDNGEWVRVFPELGSADDNGGGWHCDDPGIAELAGDFGDTTQGIDPTREN